MRGVTGNELTMLAHQRRHLQRRRHRRPRRLDETTMDMFRAVKHDKLAEFVYTNPSVLSDRK